MECLWHAMTDRIIVRCRLSPNKIMSSVTSALRTSRTATSYCISTFTGCRWLADYWQQSHADTADLWLTSVLCGWPVYSMVDRCTRVYSEIVELHLVVSEHAAVHVVQTLVSITMHIIIMIKLLSLGSKIYFFSKCELSVSSSTLSCQYHKTIHY